MRNQDSPSVPAYFGERAREHVRAAIVKSLVVLFATLAIALGAILATWPERPARFYVPEAR